jgi:hypothetical protein
MNCATHSISYRAFSTHYNRWNESAREALFSTLSYAPSTQAGASHAIFKIGNDIELSILHKILNKKPLSLFLPPRNGLHTSIYYHSGGCYFRKCIERKLSNEYKELPVKPGTEKTLISTLSSSLYYFWWLTESDCYHVTKTDVLEFPVTPNALSDSILAQQGEKLLIDLERNAIVRNRRRKNGEVVQDVNYYVGKSKSLLDDIDLVLSKHYGLTGIETDSIINYDIKYRMGGTDDEE